jgi:hypothetical protein
VLEVVRKVLNFTEDVVDIFKGAAFRKLYLNEMNMSGKTCRMRVDGIDRMGACLIAPVPPSERHR